MKHVLFPPRTICGGSWLALHGEEISADQDSDQLHGAAPTLGRTDLAHRRTSVKEEVPVSEEPSDLRTHPSLLATSLGHPHSIRAGAISMQATSPSIAAAPRLSRDGCELGVNNHAPEPHPHTSSWQLRQLQPSIGMAG